MSRTYHDTSDWDEGVCLGFCIAMFVLIIVIWMTAEVATKADSMIYKNNRYTQCEKQKHVWEGGYDI